MIEHGLPSVDAAMELGRKASAGITRGNKWEPAGVAYPGWLTAYVRKPGGFAEGVHKQGSTWYWSRVGETKKGDLTANECREAGARKVAEAMIGESNPDRDALISELAGERMKRATTKAAEMAAEEVISR